MKVVLEPMVAPGKTLWGRFLKKGLKRFINYKIFQYHIVLFAENLSLITFSSLLKILLDEFIKSFLRLRVTELKNILFLDKFQKTSLFVIKVLCKFCDNQDEAATFH